MTSLILYIWSKHLVISASAGHVCGRVPYPAVAVDNDNIWSICGRPFSTAPSRVEGNLDCFLTYEVVIFYKYEWIYYGTGRTAFDNLLVLPGPVTFKTLSCSMSFHFDL